MQSLSAVLPSTVDSRQKESELRNVVNRKDYTMASALLENGVSVNGADDRKRASTLPRTSRTPTPYHTPHPVHLPLPHTHTHTPNPNPNL